jgi:arsenate reductase
MPAGSVKYFNAAKGFGFITPDGGGPDVFVHATAVEQAELAPLAEGQRLNYEIESDPKGRKAVKLTTCTGEDARAVPSRAATAVPNHGLVPNLTIYHNPDCQNSVNTLAILRAAGHEPLIVEYMKHPPTKAELKSLVVRMKVSARELVRKVEPLYMELGLNAKEVSDEALFDAMAQNPILINRPVVAVASSARLCRPSSVVTAFISEIAGSGSKPQPRSLH